ncbi:putative LPS assembly protein LptD [Fulvivirga sp. M361]|uniref:putative LPS assembly protein LptD n=1 Tax=Fulvivirga sp. M361 TaxID=2594266 RepID=UPI001623AA9E|nr:putative LPS assembly protein LptD [Fulvivirga sp. M361]
MKFSLNPKNTPDKLNFRALNKVGFVSVFLVFFISSALGQTPEKKVTVSEELLGTQPVPADTTINGDSTLLEADSLATSALDSADVAPEPSGDIETTINYSARDSINFSVDTRIVKLYGDAKITYGSIELEADHIVIDYTNNTLSANGQLDSTGTRVGYPIFKNGSEVYETRDITYNFKTGRARITEVVTQQGEGYLHGETVFKNEKNELFSIDNTYTTCNLRNPHFRIRAKRTKAIPDDKIIAGPFNLEINDVPTPLGFFFGMFPAKNEASSGIIVPSYGEEQRRGFFLRGGGYFFDISDYVKTAVRGDIYSKGGHGLNVSTVYKTRYKNNGSVNFNYTNLRTSDNIEVEDSQNDFRLTWTHTPESKGRSRFSASVNAATSTFNSNNFLGINNDPNNPRLDAFTRKLNSTVTYSTTFGSLFSLGLSARHNQDISTREVNLLLPSLTFNMSNIYPFRSKTGSNAGVLSKLSLRYTLTGTNDITNNLGRIGSDAATDSIAPFDFDNLGTFLETARRGFRHSIPLATSFKLLKHFTASPSFNYDERWYFEQLEYGIDPENSSNAIVIDTLNGFNRISTYSTSLGVNTRLYGTYFFKKGSVQAIRHVINPSLSFSYSPDFSAERFGYYQRLTNEEGEEILADRYRGFAFGSASSGESGSIGLSLTNTLEMKVKTKKDTTDQARKVPILNNFGFSTSYNIVADSFKLANISVRANTALFERKLNVNFTGTLDPYIYREDGTESGRRIDQFSWNNGKGIGQLSRATVALSTNLNPKARDKDAKQNDKINESELSPEEKEFLFNNPDAYVDFEIPWSLRINYNLNYTKQGLSTSEITQTLRFSGDLSLSEKWKLNFNSGYDFENKEFTTTTLGINRDLHCWVMDFNWTPFGRFTSYTFTIRVKSSLLQDLKIDRNRSFFDQF